MAKTVTAEKFAHMCSDLAGKVSAALRDHDMRVTNEVLLHLWVGGERAMDASDDYLRERLEQALHSRVAHVGAQHVS